MRFIFSGFADEASKEFIGQVNALKRNNYQHLEIRNVGGKKLTEVTLAEAKEMANILAHNGLSVWSMGSPIGKMKVDADWQQHLDAYRRVLDMAAIFGAKRIRMFSFFMPKEDDPANWKNWVLDKLAVFAELSKEYDVTLCHENEKGIYGDMAARCLEIHKALPQIKAVFDPANFVQCGQDTLQAWEMLAPYVEYMHVKDALTNGTVVPAGKGQGNVQAIIGKYAAQGGKVLSLEPHLTQFVGFKELEADTVSVVGAMHFENGDEAFDYAANALYGLVERL